MKVAKLLPYIKEIRVSCLNLGILVSNSAQNHNSSILKEISTVAFPILKILNLSSNSIDCISSLKTVKLPMIECLYLGIIL